MKRTFTHGGADSTDTALGIKFKLLLKEARKHGIKTVIRDLVRVAGKVLRYARSWKLLFYKAALRIDWLYHAAGAIENSS